MKAQLLLLASLSGCTLNCGGAPFSFPPGWPYDGGSEAETGVELALDGGAEDSKASPAPDAGELDANPAPDVGSAMDAAPDVAPVCSPVTATPHDTCPLEPSTPDPFPSCYDRMAAAPPQGCPTVNACESTPQACQCRETFNCACLKTNGVNWKNCIDVGGAPWVY